MVEYITRNKLIQRLEYVWTCPDCGDEMTNSMAPASYNVICNRCRIERRTRERDEYFGENGIMKTLNESEITTILGCDVGEIESIEFKHPDGRIINLYASAYDDQEAWMEVG